MIDGFEKETQELNEYELTVLLPLIIRGLQTKIGENKAITSTLAIKKLKESGHKISGPRFRKIVNHIRVSGLIPLLLASSKGYYIAEKRSDVKRFIDSLDQRLNAITLVRDSLEYQYKMAINKQS